MAQRLAIVTGTTSGVGQAVARILLQCGWQVLGIARRVSTISDAAYDHLRADLHDMDALTSLVEPRLTKMLADASLSRVGLVNNAADPALLGPIATLDTRRLPAVFTVNVAAPSKAALRLASMALAAESEPSRFAGGLSVVSYEPGTVDTPMQAYAREQPPSVLPSVARSRLVFSSSAHLVRRPRLPPAAMRQLR